MFCPVGVEGGCLCSVTVGSQSPYGVGCASEPGRVRTRRALQFRVCIERVQPQPEPPPPPPPPPPAPPTPARTDTLKSIKSAQSMPPEGAGDMQQELRAVLTLYQQHKNKLDIKKTPDIFIHQTSNPAEVAQWLTAKGFSEHAARELRVSGHELFSLSRAQLELLLGADEGKRLYSQVLVQRNVSGYKTTTSSELQSILRKLREKVEVS